MTNLTFQISKNEILRKISNNLGVTDISKSSQLSNLADGLLDITQVAFDQISATFANNFIETCDNETLDKIGVQAGLPRYVKSRLRVSQADAAMELTIDPSDVLLEDVVQLLTAGDILTINSSVVLRITSDITVTLDKHSKTRIIIGGVLSSYNESAPIGILAESSLSFTPKTQIRPNLVRYNIKFLKSITSTVVEESYTDYRSRLLAYVTSPKYSTELAIDTLVANYPYVDNYYINTAVYPAHVYLLNKQMYYTQDSDYLINNYAIAALSDELNMIAAHGSVYTVSKAKKVSVKILIETSDVELQSKFSGQSFKDFLYQVKSLNQFQYLDKNLIQDYLKQSYTAVPPFGFKIYYSFSGFLVEVPKAEIPAGCYPYVEEIYHGLFDVSGVIGTTVTDEVS